MTQVSAQHYTVNSSVVLLILQYKVKMNYTGVFTVISVRARCVFFFLMENPTVRSGAVPRYSDFLRCGYQIRFGAVIRYGSVRFAKNEILRCGSVRFSEIRNLTVRGSVRFSHIVHPTVWFGAVITSYGAVWRGSLLDVLFTVRFQSP